MPGQIATWPSGTKTGRCWLQRSAEKSEWNMIVKCKLLTFDCWMSSWLLRYNIPQSPSLKFYDGKHSIIFYHNGNMVWLVDGLTNVKLIGKKGYLAVFEGAKEWWLRCTKMVFVDCQWGYIASPEEVSRNMGGAGDGWGSVLTFPLMIISLFNMIQHFRQSNVGYMMLTTLGRYLKTHTFDHWLRDLACQHYSRYPIVKSRRFPLLKALRYKCGLLMAQHVSQKSELHM